MGNTKSKQLTLTSECEDSIILPIPLYLTSPHCESIQSITYNQTAFEFEHNSATYTDAQFLFDSQLDNQINDCWCLYHPQKFGLNKSPQLKHTIHRISKHCKQSNSNINNWLSVFGTQIIRKGDYKIWKLKIYPRNDTINYIINNKSFPIADIVIGIVDIDTINKQSKYYNYNGGFWTEPFFGYGYYGYNGKKFHNERRGKQYNNNNKYKVGDTITIELDLQCNQLT
eukprot:22306_1